MFRRLFVAASVILPVVPPRSASAQPRPLPIATVEGAGAGNVTLETSVDYTRDAFYTLSGLGGDLRRLGLIRIDVGLSSIADFELSGGLRDHLSIKVRVPAALSGLLQLSDPTSTSAFDDIVVATKIRLRAERPEAPGFAVRFGTRLPNAKHSSGLGQDTTDFYSSLIIGQPISRAHIAGNAGFGALGDPLRGDRRVGSFLYGVMIRGPIASRVTLVAGVDGRTGPMEPGLESRAIARAGIEWTRGPVRVELDGTRGLTVPDGHLGAVFTVGYAFHAFTPTP
jgi:hypothetical protein